MGECFVYIGILGPQTQIPLQNYFKKGLEKGVL